MARQLWVLAEQWPVLLGAFEILLDGAIKRYQQGEQADIKAAAKGRGLNAELESYREGR